MSPDTVEVLLHPNTCKSGTVLLESLHEAARHMGLSSTMTNRYAGKGYWLLLWGIGGAGRTETRAQHISSKLGRVCCWDMGYFKRSKAGGYFRFGLDADTPADLLGQTSTDARRWDALGLPVLDYYNPDGPILLCGMGVKQRQYLLMHGQASVRNWERGAVEMLQQQYPNRRILYRPKPGKPPLAGLDLKMQRCEDTDDAIRGCSLVVCHTSNVAVDALRLGVPFLDLGAGVVARYSGRRIENTERQQLLCRLANWQYKATEAAEFWKFLLA